MTLEERKLYNVLLNDCGVFMPPIQDANVGYVRGVVTGTTKYVKSQEVKVIQVPLIKGLSTEDILNFVRSKKNILDYLPHYTTFRLPNRQWFSNLVNTLIGQDFKVWIDSKMGKREKLLINKKSFTVQVLPEFSKAFQTSKSVSTVGGRSHFLLKQPNLRKRKYEEIKEIVASSNEDDIREAELISEVQLLKERINEYKMIQLEDSKYKEIVENLIEKGVINQNGDELIKF